MSNKYEREIEEILRKMDDGRPPSVTDRLNAMKQRQKPTRLRPRVGLSIPPATWMVTGFVIAFLAEIVRWILHGGADLQPTRSVVDLVLAITVVAGFVMLAGALIYTWVRGPQAPSVGWRGSSLGQGGRGPDRGPFSELRARWNLLRLRMGYRRRGQ